MFAQGPRFAPEQILEVPGPNFYQPTDGFEHENYKRGAFLEKTARFKVANPSDVPGPGTYNIEVESMMQPQTGSLQGKPPLLPSGSNYGTLKQQFDVLRIQNSRLQKEHEHLKKAFERSETNVKSHQDKILQFTSLQRRLEDLERVHNEGKKMHLVEVEQIKIELERSRKSNKEQSERICNVKKQNEVAEIRIQELKKSALADQSEIKGLRHKLRVAEQDRNQLIGKQGDTVELKKTVQSIESKRREETRERDQRLAEMQKSLALERQQSIAIEGQLKELKSKAERDTEDVRTVNRALEQRLQESQSIVWDVETAYRSLEQDFSTTNDARLEQIDQLNTTIRRVAEEYGRLASSTVPSSTHTQARLECASLHLKMARLERKLANSDDQVCELVHLIRHYQDKNNFLLNNIQEAEVQLQLALRISSLSDITETRDNPTDNSFCEEIDAFITDRMAFEETVHLVTVNLNQGIYEYYRIKYDELLLHNRTVEQALADGHEQVESLTCRLAEADRAQSKLIDEQKDLTRENVKLQTQQTTQAQELKDIRAQLARLKEDLLSSEKQAQAELIKCESLLKQEREAVHRLTATIRLNKMAEEGMQAEIDQLSSELADIACYQDAYQNLMEEMGGLVARNALAEDEAERLSKFNAEILGHRNPTQRIFYVDKIRRELADTKQKLLASTRGHDTLLGENESLRAELYMYKSVAVPVEEKPRTAITRVARVPLVPRDLRPNLSQNNPDNDLAEHLPPISMCEMTLAEIM